MVPSGAPNEVVTSSPPGLGPAPGREPIGLLVVHGIGRQTRGKTLAGIVSGLQTAYAGALRVTWNDTDYALVEGLGPPVHGIEAYWADVFQDEDVRGTFNTDRIFELVWFPSLNWKSGLLTAELVPRGRVRLWTATLAVLSPFVSCALFGADMFATLFTGRSPVEMERDKRQDGESWWESLNRRRGERPRTKFDDLMDQVAGDVFNYVDGLSRSFLRDTPQAQRLCRSVDEIRHRFEDSARRAVEGGCREIQVVAHSLGSVITFASMSSSAPQQTPARGPTARLTGIYTIGCPLEKVRFFWPRLVEGSEEGPVISAGGRLVATRDGPGQTDTMWWHNFYNKLDLVSGQLRAFRGWPSPTNHALPALGGVLSSHVAYHANPSFLAYLGEGLGGRAPTTHSPWGSRFRHAIVATLQTIAAPVLFLLLALIGTAMLLGVAWGVGWVLAKPFDLIGLSGVAAGVRIYMVALIAFAIFINSAIIGHGEAKKAHARFWVHAGPRQ